MTCFTVRSPATGTVRSAANASPALTVTPMRVVAKTADKVFRNMARVLVARAIKTRKPPPCPPKKLFEDNADPVLSRPDHPAIAQQAVALRHQLEPVRDEQGIGHLDRRAVGRNVDDPAARAGAMACD